MTQGKVTFAKGELIPHIAAFMQMLPAQGADTAFEPGDILAEIAAHHAIDGHRRRADVKAATMGITGMVPARHRRRWGLGYLLALDSNGRVVLALKRPAHDGRTARNIGLFYLCAVSAIELESGQGGMSRYQFSDAQRYAIFLVHGRKCYMCGVPLDLTSMEVDHVVPERLLATPSLFEDAKSALGLPASFDLNSFENWMPACCSCNGKKAALQFQPSLLIQVVVQRLAEKADEARRLCDEVVSARRVSIALNALVRAQESGRNFDESTRDRLLDLLRFASERALLPKGQPLRLTQSFRLVATTIEDATRWGATHWSMPPREPGEPALVVLFRAERGECVECGLTQRVFQPINQEGGGDPICDACLSTLDWMPPVTLGDLPTHVTQDSTEGIT